MVLSPDQDELEHALRVEQMQTNIELMHANIDKFRADIATQQKQLEWATRKWVVSMVVAAAALLGAGIALGNFLTLHPLHF